MERAYIAQIQELGRPEDDAADNYVVIVVPDDGKADTAAEHIAAKHGYRIVELHDSDNNYPVVRA